MHILHLDKYCQTAFQKTAPIATKRAPISSHPHQWWFLPMFLSVPGLPLWLSWWKICLQCGRPGFDPWVGKIPWRRERLPTPVFWPGEFHGLYTVHGGKLTFTFTLSVHILMNKKLFQFWCNLHFFDYSWGCSLYQSSTTDNRNHSTSLCRKIVG